MGRRLGIIAGSGKFPFYFLQEAQNLGYSCVVAGIKGEAENDLENKADVFEWIDIDGIFKLITFFKNQGVNEAVFAGKVDHRKIYKEGKLGKALLGLLAKGKDRSPTAIIETAIGFLYKKGIEIIEPTKFITSAFCDEGILTRKRPSREEDEDIAFGWDIARKIADLDIGQTVVVKDKAVVAVEGMEGTDEAIKRGGLIAGEGAVVVKVSRTLQDPRIDLPVVGLNTVESLVEAKAGALCFEAQYVPFFQREKAVSLADANRISIVAKKAEVRRNKLKTQIS